MVSVADNEDGSVGVGMLQPQERLESGSPGKQPADKWWSQIE
jgi:hypothetical protein